MRPALPPTGRALALAGLVATLTSLTMWSHAEATYRRASFRPEDDLLVLPRAEVLRVGSLGHTELFADLVWVRAVVYTGTEIVHHGPLKWLDRYLETVIALDPQFRRPYQWAGVITIYNGRGITNDMVAQSSHFLELGTQHFPNDWEFPFMLVCNYLHELHSDDPRQRTEWRRQGAEYVRRAALIGGGPPWLSVLAATIYTREGENDLAIRHLEEIYASSEDPRVREQVGYKLTQLRARTDAERIDRARLQLEQGWRAWAPYVPLDLFVLVGEARPDRTLEQVVEGPALAPMDTATPTATPIATPTATPAP